MSSDDGSMALPADPAAPPLEKSLKTRTLQGLAWTLAGDGGSQIIRFVSNLILSRLLVPEAFGIMVVVTVVQQGLAMFSDVGIQPAIVQHKRGDDPVFLNTAWTTQVIRGFLLWAASSAVAHPVAIYAGEPMLVYILPVVGLGPLFDGFLSTKVFTCDRHLALGRLTLMNFGSAMMGLVARISWALMSPTVWALVAGGLAATIPRVLLSHWILPGPVNRFRWDRQAFRELSQFGRWVFLSTILTFVSLQLDKIVFVKMIPLAMLGIYNIGATFARLPVETLQTINSRVAFPALSRLRERKGNLQSAYDRIRAPLLAGCGAILAFLILAGPLVTRILYPALYHDAGWIMQIVAVGLWFQAIQATNQPVLLALGMPKWLAAGNIVKIAFMVVVLPLTYRRWGFGGALMGMAAVEIPRYLVEAFQVRARGLRGWGVELGITAAVLCCAALAWALQVWSPAGGGAGIKMAVASACFVVIWLPLLFWARRVAAVTPS